VKLTFTFYLALLAFTMASFGVQTVAHEVQQKSVERRAVMIPIDDFDLVDQNSRDFKFSKLTGRVKVVAFAYTTCPDICPLITAALREIQSGLTPEESKNVFLLTITTDPEIDSPSVLAGYGKRYGADFANWAFLSGNPIAMQKIWKNFGVGVNRKARGLVDHTPLIALVDRHNKLRVAYVGPAPVARIVLQDVRTLLKQ
jgi:protein SCO1/2